MHIGICLLNEKMYTYLMVNETTATPANFSFYPLKNILMTNRTCIPFSMVNQLLDTWISNPKETLRECWISFDIHSKKRL